MLSNSTTAHGPQARFSLFATGLHEWRAVGRTHVHAALLLKQRAHTYPHTKPSQSLPTTLGPHGLKDHQDPFKLLFYLR